jgi:hypothetical protein
VARGPLRATVRAAPRIRLERSWANECLRWGPKAMADEERAGRDRYVYEKLKAAVPALMSHRGSPRDRLLLVFLTNLAWLREDELPEGELREGFRMMMDRTLAGVPAGARMEPDAAAYETAFRCLSDDDVQWVADMIHALAFSMAERQAACFSGDDSVASEKGHQER